MSSYYWLGIVAFFVAIFQGWLLYRSKSYTKISSAFTILTLILIFQHALEFVLSILLATNPDRIDPYANLFMASLYCTGLALMYLAKTVVDSKVTDNAFKIMCGFTLIIAALHINGKLFSGFLVTDYTLISIGGEYEGLWFTYVACILNTVLGSLILGTTSKNKESKRRAIVALKSLSPIILSTMGVVVLRQIGFNASTAIVLPLSTAACTAMLMLEERNEFVFYEESLKDQWARYLIKMKIIYFLVFKLEKLDRKVVLDEVDSIMVNGALTRKETKLNAAAFLNSKRTTFNRAVERVSNSK